jgi:hypothetical protein
VASVAAPERQRTAWAGADRVRIGCRGMPCGRARKKSNSCRRRLRIGALSAGIGPPPAWLQRGSDPAIRSPTTRAPRPPSTGWPASIGMGGRHLRRNQWPVCVGISGRLRSEYAVWGGSVVLPDDEPPPTGRASPSGHWALCWHRAATTTPLFSSRAFMTQPSPRFGGAFFFGERAERNWSWGRHPPAIARGLSIGRVPAWPTITLAVSLAAAGLLAAPLANSARRAE